MKSPKLGTCLTVRKVFLAMCLFFLLPSLSKAQDKPFRVPCPTGTRPLPHGVTVDPSIDNLVAFLCVDKNGNVFFISDNFQTTTGNPAGGAQTGSGAPTGSCAANVLYVDTTTGRLYTCNGGTWTPAVASGFTYAETGLDALFSNTINSGGFALQQNANATLPGYALLGPVPNNSNTNPVFETATISVGGSSPATISGIPIAATSIGVVLIKTASGVNSATPSGFTAFSGMGGGFQAFYQNLSSTVQINVSSSFTTTAWVASLNFLGGAITSIPHSGTGFASCGGGCISGSLGPIASGNTVIVFLGWASGTGTPRDTVCTDNIGNSYLTASVVGSSSTIATVTAIAQNSPAGTATITCRTSLGALWGNASAYELAGTGPYYTGPIGPYTFRPITTADLTGSVGGLGFSKIQAQSSAGCTTAATSYSNCDVTLTWPTAFIDTGYIPVCMGKDTNMQASGGDGSTGDVPSVFIRSFTASQIVVAERTDAARAITNTNITIYCWGLHP